jgi:hypothetical protein
MLVHTSLDANGRPLSPCGREKILDSVEQELLAYPARPRADD